MSSNPSPPRGEASSMAESGHHSYWSGAKPHPPAHGILTVLSMPLDC